MAYDLKLADRIRQALAEQPEVTEKKMFGGLAFLVAGNMAVTASGRGGLMVRVPPDDADALISSTNAEAMTMGSRTMRGWLHLDGADVRTKRQLAPWVERGLDTARSLPPKP